MAREAPCDCKVGRDIERYGLAELDETVVQYRQEHETSLRDLAEYVNHRILEAAIADTADDVFTGQSDLFGALEREDAVAQFTGPCTTTTSLQSAVHASASVWSKPGWISTASGTIS